jgi:hypothetical protein
MDLVLRLHHVNRVITISIKYLFLLSLIRENNHTKIKIKLLSKWEEGTRKART